MDYPESKEQAAEFLRLALPLMARHDIPANPQHYTVWYEYVSGRNQPLKEAVDSVLYRNGHPSAELSRDFYQRFFHDPEAHVAEQMRQEVRHRLGDVVHELATSSGQATHYGRLLEESSARLAEELGTEEFRNVLNQVITETDVMRDTNRALEARLSATTRELARLRQELETARQEASTDALTGVANRGAFDAALLDAITQANAQGSALSLVMADIDHFKRFNDNHGHLVGDKLLRFVATTLKGSVKGQDLVARFGGEEFVILLPATPLHGALTVAEQIRANLQGQRLRRTDTAQSIGHVTLSFGVAAYRPGESAEAFVKRSDTALYRSKRLGRNRVSCATSDA